MQPNRFYFHSDDRRINKVDPDGLYGVDPGDRFSPSDVAMDFIHSLNDDTLLHFYCVGPGMMSWSSQERSQIEYLANLSKVDTTQDNWHDEWIKIGWHRYVWAFFNLYHKNYAAYSVEIDNLDSAFSTAAEYAAYFAKLEANLRDAKVPTKLMLKNVPVEALLLLKPTSFFAPWAIFEKGTGDERTQIALCKRLGIRAITPCTGLLDTNHYGVLDEGIASLPSQAEAQTT